MNKLFYRFYGTLKEEESPLPEAFENEMCFKWLSIEVPALEINDYKTEEDLEKDKQYLIQGLRWIKNTFYSMGITNIQHRINTAYQLLSDVHSICKKYNIDYWMEGGTLLGAIRNKGFIPWDSDVDLGMTDTAFDSFEKKLTKHLPYITLSYKYRKHTDTMPDGKKVFFSRNIGTVVAFGNLITQKQLIIDIQGHEFKGLGHINLDVSIYSEKQGDSFYGWHHPQINVWEAKLHYNVGASFYHGELYPLRLYNFGPLKLYGPSNPIPYLERCYGTKKDPSSWKTPTRYHNNGHRMLEKPIIEDTKDCALPTIKILDRKLDNTEKKAILCNPITQTECFVDMEDNIPFYIQLMNKRIPIVTRIADFSETSEEFKNTMLLDADLEYYKNKIIIRSSYTFKGKP